MSFESKRQRIAFAVSLVVVLSGCGDHAASTNNDAAITTDAATDGGVIGPEGVDAETTGVDAGLLGDTTTQVTAPPRDVDACDPDAPLHTRTITLPLGETLHFSGDDYLAFWGRDPSCGTVLTVAPESATATLVVDEDGNQRWTPDLAGSWEFTRGQATLVVEVDDAYLTPDTFVNYNYSPVTPITETADGALWVASPVSNAVHRVNIANGDLAADTLVPTGSWPTSLATWRDAEDTEWLLVSQTGRDSLGFLNPATRTLVDALWVGNEPAGVVVDGDIAYVALSGEDRVARVDLGAREVIDTIAVGHDPRAMVLDTTNGRLFVASLISSNAHPRGTRQEELIPTSEQRDIAVIDTDTFTVSGWVHEVGTILRGLWIDADATELIVAVSHAHNMSAAVDADTQPHTHALVRVDVDVASETPLTVVGEVDLDGQPSSLGPAASPFTMALTPNGEHFIVTLAAGQAVLVLDAETHEELERLPAGSDPRGLVFAEGRFWTYAWLDNQLLGMPLPGQTTDVIWTSIGDDPTPLEVKQGQRMFNDASFSKHADFSCNNCHIDGITDGLVWDLLTDGPVNTIAFRNVGGTSPFLWGGQLPTLFDFSREVLKLVGANASGAQMQLLTTYMQSVTAPPNPYTRPGGRLTEDGEAGKALFDNEAKCGGCHGGTLLTSQLMVDGKTPGVKTDVPSLFGTYDTGPWGREGQWTTLDAMVEYAVEFSDASLSGDEMEALKAYVREQPADRLYLTSSTPLNHAHHIWRGTPVELVFSGAMVPGQEDRFTFSHLDEETEETAPVAGEWHLSGRVARFIPEAEFALESSYRIDIRSPLNSTLGQSTPEDFTIEFKTGGLPELDVSGNWNLELCEDTLVGCLDLAVALLQSDGGQVTGVALDNFDEGSVDHLEGVVDGTVLALDPFTVDSVIGPVFVENGITVTLWDTDDDGFADAGQGEVPFDILGGSYLVQVYVNRTSLPDEESLGDAANAN